MSPAPPTPPFLLLQTIEAVTRRGSFREAAEELLVTPSAVSHRIHSVEQMLGARLFERMGQGVKPTAAALTLGEAVGAARVQIDRAWQAVAQKNDEHMISVRCMAGFGEHFILPQMDVFRRTFSNIDLDLSSSVYSDAQAVRPYDFVIGLGAPPPGKWQVEPLMPLLMHPIVAPHRLGDMLVDGALSGPLIGYGASPLTWAQIADTLGHHVHPDAKIVTFDSIVSACIAAEHGLGIALAPSFIAARMEREGKAHILCRDRPIDTELNYWLAAKPEQHGWPTFARFRRWLKTQIAQDKAKR